MIVGIMQPYFLPYIGYFQLISHCDALVLLDDVQYIYGGWVNRNRILVAGLPAWATMPVLSASHTLAINKRAYDHSSGLPKKIIRRIDSAYHRAASYGQVFPLVTRIMANKDSNVADFNARAIGEIVAYLGITTEIHRSSQMTGLNGLKGVDRVIAICKALKASTYVNPIGGVSLYASTTFSKEGIELKFLETIARPYIQFAPQFVPCLSIIDLLMHNDAKSAKIHLGEYRIIQPSRDH